MGFMAWSALWFALEGRIPRGDADTGIIAEEAIDAKAEGRRDLASQIAAALGQGIDGFFTDFPLQGVEARNALRTGAK